TVRSLPCMRDSLGICTWSSVLARISELLPIEESAREFKAFLRARGVRRADDLLRLALNYAGGNSLRGSSAWAEASGVAELSTPALYHRLGKAADWLGFIARSFWRKPVRRLLGTGQGGGCA